MNCRYFVQRTMQKYEQFTYNSLISPKPNIQARILGGGVGGAKKGKGKRRGERRKRRRKKRKGKRKEKREGERKSGRGRNGKAIEAVAPTRKEVKMAPLPCGAVKNTYTIYNS